MTYQNRLEDIRTYIQALAKHLRYMLNIQSQWISLSEELGHIENYLKMQQLRFPDSVTDTIECSDEAGKTQVPFLIVFTLVENTFKHALSLYKPMELNISCTITDDGKFCSIKVEDNGDGFPAEVLEEFQTQSAENALPSKDHLGLSNVRYTLNYIYKRSDLLRLSNKEGGGAVAQILIPLTEEEK
jgi:sensor histidine kinase YesM